MAVSIKRSGVVANLSLTPLIDVVFLLLIFFLVTSRFEEEERRLDIVLPSATSAAPMIHRPREIVVDVDAQGNIYLRGQPTDYEELRRLLASAVVDHPIQQSVIIRADANARFQPVVNVMDLCNQTGIVDYSVTTRDAPLDGD